MKTILLNKILAEAQINRINQIMHTEPASLERTRKLRAYLISIQSDLVRQGVDAEYLTYVIEASFLSSMEQNAEAERKNAINN